MVAAPGQYPAAVRGLRTFDVFDTLLIRRVALPSSAFLTLGHELADAGVVGCTPEVFARARERAEPLAVARSGSAQATLVQICEQLAELLELPPETATTLVEHELAHERAMTVAVPGMAGQLDELRDTGVEIAFVSDMYLPTPFVTELLDTHGLRRGGERVHVSVDVGLTKRHGGLHPHVLAEHGSPTDVVHTGDDIRGDVEQAQAAGITAVLASAATPNRYEVVLEQHRWASSGLSSAMAGASRIARLSVPAATEHERALRDVAAGVAGPLLVGYVSWVLRRAADIGIDRLYFASRDGQVLLRIAERLSEGAGDTVALHYLHGSRHAWYPAVADPDQPEHALATLGHATDGSLDVVLDRCGVDPADWPTPGTASGRLRLRRGEAAPLRADPALLAAITTGLRVRHAQILAYLSTVGFLEEARVGVVDIGWHGRSLDSLTALLQREGHPAPTGFYLGLDQDRARLRQPVEVWLAGYERRLRFLMLETFCAGTHGQVTGYRIGDDGRAEPVLHSEGNEPARRWGLPLVRATIDAFVDALIPLLGRLPGATDIRHAAMDAFSTFYDRPTPVEARAWGSFPFEVDPAAAITEQLAPGRDLPTLVRDRVTGSGSSRWPAGDLALAPRSWHVATGTWGRAKRIASGRRSR